MATTRPQPAMARFVDGLGARIGALEAARVSDDLEALGALGGRLKGTAAMVRFGGLHVPAAGLEAAGHEVASSGSSRSRTR